MPNICCFDAKIKGKKEAIKKLTEWMQAKYQYTEEEPLCYLEENGEKINTEHHIGGRVFSFELSEEIPDTDGIVTVEAIGDCAWSVKECMFDGLFAYFNDFKKHKKCKSITITDACRELNLTFEIFSEEPGLCFAEHYLIEKGNVIIDECVDYYETFIDEYKTFDEIEKTFKKGGWTLPFGKEQFDSTKAVGGSYVSTCEFLDNGDCWPFILN